jgi:DNA-binding response OmpR family regulator
MLPEALIYSSDENLSKALSVVLSRTKLDPVCVSRVGGALNLLRRRKFPAIIVDCLDRPAAKDLFELCRRVGSNKSSIVFALTGANESAVSLGVSFAVTRPVDLDVRAFANVLRTAEGMILQDFRRYRRIPINSFAMLDNDEHSLKLKTVNVSEGGMCVQGEIPGWNKEHKVQLTHPEINSRFRADSYVVWSRNGRSGIQFRYVTPSARDVLYHWLEAR